ncbi:hypothetical protein RJ55_06990 [Drechmeria coniospora]|nr:hypothetical protein RJ55_06990 [Drechmeria coniospora]
MLKTTTETGDIGLFSIKAGVSPATYSHPPRKRLHLADAGPLPLPRARLYDDANYPDDYRRFRSYRDTTSEIISLYGSDNQQYWLQASPPLFLDEFPRSYSLTPCSSRQMPFQKFSGTLQSHANAGLQRPRSPFPYPTRLKRPGVRPASPALAENGGIDYSRMVELDRVSQRTVHGSYKPSYAHGSRRPPPLSLRAEANRSTASLPLRSSPGSCHFSSGPGRIRTPGSAISAISRSYDRQHAGSFDQSVRSASLTSIVEMYQRPTTACSTGQPLRSAGSFYYDYSEEFDKPAPLNPFAELEAPICPIPQRAGSSIQPMVLRDDTQAHLDTDTSPDGDLHLPRCRQDESAAINIMGSDARRRHRHDHSIRSIDDVLLNAVDAKPPQMEISANTDDFDESCLTELLGGHDDTPSAPSASEPSVINRQGLAARPKGEPTGDGENIPASQAGVWRRSKALGSGSEPPECFQTKRASSSNRKPFRCTPECTLDPAMSEFASLFSSFDGQATTTPSASRGEEVAKERSCALSSSHGDIKAGRLPEPHSRHPSVRLAKVATADVDAVHKRRHRRNAAATRIDTDGLADIGAALDLAPPESEMAILSPEPISPAGQLRVKHSIPQLMKALPPLPREANGTPDAARLDEAHGHDGSETLAPSKASTAGNGFRGTERSSDESGPLVSGKLGPGTKH